jgi:CubicO group peptidase (beta-lactamase class C family)
VNDATDDLAHLGLDPSRWERVASLAAELCRSPGSGLVLQVVRPECRSLPLVWGDRIASGGESLRHPLRPETIFLTASLSKPIVAMGVLSLVEAGEVSLQSRVQEFLPEFDAPPKRPITLRHLLTHTSGLPDMLPNNRPLRQAQSPLAKFIAGACAVTLDFPPGRGVQYQSLGYALLGEIITRVTGRRCADYLRQTLFEPLGMVDTALGAPEEWFTGPAPRMERVAEVLVPEEQRGGDDWNWNSRYWRTLGAPWGGVLSTADDLSTFLQMMLGRGRRGNLRLFASATIDAATTNQLEAFHDVPEADRRTRGWGLGWRLNWIGHPAAFGDLLPPCAYGHWGATGTLWWVDPLRRVGLVLLSTLPLDRDQTGLLRLSNAVAAAVLD